MKKKVRKKTASPQKPRKKRWIPVFGPMRSPGATLRLNKRRPRRKYSDP